MQDTSTQLRVFMQKHKLTQEDLAAKAKVSQATVSRALYGPPQRHGRATMRLLQYASIHLSATGPKVTGADRVIRAFRKIWDGSDVHAFAVAKIIEALEGMKPSGGARKGPLK